MDVSTIGKRIKVARERAGLSQRTLGERCEWGQSRINNYEQDDREPTVADLNKIATVLEIDPAWLILGGNGEYSPEPPRTPKVHEYHLQPEAIDVAMHWMQLPPFKQDLYREMIEHDAALTKALPWYAKAGRPKGGRYGGWEDHIQSTYDAHLKQLKLTFE